MTATNSEIDAAILAVVKPSWRKVALVVGQATRRLGDFADNTEIHRSVAGRISALVSDGRLIAQGDITKWRTSEVRRP